MSRQDVNEYDRLPETRHGDLADQANASLERDLRAALRKPIPHQGMTEREARIIAMNRYCECGKKVSAARIMVNGDEKTCAGCDKTAQN